MAETRAQLAPTQFLDTKDDYTAHEMPLRSVIEESSPPALRPRPAQRSFRQKGEDQVWVDCFYYGFYMPKSKLPAYRASLEMQGLAL